MRNKFSKVPNISDIHTPSGSRFKTVYESRFNGNRLVLEATGTIDIQAEIEAWAPFTDLNFMLQRLTVGDRSVLARKEPLYGDFSCMPTNPVDAINMVKNAEERFSTLPLEYRQNYSNDFRVWLASLFNGRGSVPNSVPDSDANDDISSGKDVNKE